MIYRFCDNVFSDAVLNTLGVELKTKTVTHGKLIIKLNIYDTAGQEKFRSLTQNYYNRVDGIVMVYDVSDQISF